MKTLRLLVLFGVFSLVASSQSKAATDINLPEGLPDLAGSPMDVTYNAGTGAFVASGWLSDYNIPGPIDVGASVIGSYTLSATINNTGNLTGGTLTIDGAVGDGDTDVTLLTGILTTGAAGTAFGFGYPGYIVGENDDLFQFLFTVNGGSLASAFGGNGAAGGVVLDAWFGDTSGDKAFTGSWASFNNNAGISEKGVGDINSFAVQNSLPVPEPS